jgi:hypothetical protein
VNHPPAFASTAERLAGILAIAREQRQLLARGDLEGLQALQSRRQQLSEDIQSLDKGDRDARDTLSKILGLDQEMGCLLLAELSETKEKMKNISSLRRLVRSRLPAGRRPLRHLSRRV